MNIVLVLEESMGAQFIGHLGGLPLTPCLDKLATEGLKIYKFVCYRYKNCPWH